MENLDLKGLFTSVPMYIGLVVGFVLCKVLGKKRY